MQVWELGPGRLMVAGGFSDLALGGRFAEAASEAAGALKLGLAAVTEIDGSAQKVEYASG